MNKPVGRHPDLPARGLLVGAAVAVPAMILYAAIDVPPLPFVEDRVSPLRLLVGLPSLLLMMLWFPAPLAAPSVAGYLLGRRRQRAEARTLGPWTCISLFVVAFASHAALKAIYRLQG